MDDPLLIIDVCTPLESVEKKKRFERRVANPLVPVDEWVVRDEREAECCCSLRERRLGALSSEALPRLGDRRLEKPKIADADATARLRPDSLVEREHLSESEKPGHARRR